MSQPSALRRIFEFTAFAAFVGAVFVITFLVSRNYLTPPMETGVAEGIVTTPQGEQLVLWSDDAVEETARRVVGMFTPEAARRRPFEIALVNPVRPGPVFAELRSEGYRVANAWAAADNWQTAIVTAIEAAHAEAAERNMRREVDAIVLVLSHTPREVDILNPGLMLSNMRRGILGIHLEYGDVVWARSPTDAISQNRSIRRFMELHQQEVGVNNAEYRAGVSLNVFEGYQFLVQNRDEGITITPMLRGNVPVPMTDITREKVTELAEMQMTWMLENLHEDGRMTYKWWPSVGTESVANNMIRQFMATVCLGRMGQWQDSEEILARQVTNLEYNFENFYTEERGLGVIDNVIHGRREGAKLGAMGLAALALIERPELTQFHGIRDALLDMTYHLHQNDGSFHTFYRPFERRHDNQNFYPGEAMLAWATLYQQEKDPELLERYMRAFRYYRDWHLDPRNRNPAFVPWHTQAHFLIWEETQDPELLAFVFEMNDWLVEEMAQWDGLQYDDMRGRFYKPGGRFGPPHSSSTGVYLEGLIDAFVMARDTGDEERMATYRQTICRGLRSVMQLTFKDDVDMFYVTMRNRAFGGVRETVYVNEIRVDNVQHNLMGIIKILREFTDEDFILGSLGEITLSDEEGEEDAGEDGERVGEEAELLE